MNTLFIGQNIIRLTQTGSTNSYLGELLISEKLPEGTVVIAQMQEQGRGQRGAGWHSEPNKNLTLSILLHPAFLRPDEQFLLNQAVSLGVLDVIRRMVPESTVLIKWPNDIYIGGKKVAGILIENSLAGNKLQHSVIGIGINVNQEKFPPDLPNPVSLKSVAGIEYDLETCLSQLCSCMEKRYLELRAGHFLKITDAYMNHLYRFGEWYNYKYKGNIIEAKITGVSKMGKLVLEKAQKEKLECDFKEVGFC